MTHSPAAPLPPEIPDYELLQRIGRGSYGDVWIARTATSLYRAVKVVWRDRFPDSGPYEREFRGLREFEKVSLVQPRQLALLHVSRRDEEGFFYYVMELADDVEKGRDIRPETYQPLTLMQLRKGGAMEVTRVLELGVELARGLAVLHDHNLVHRDIKPSNVVMVGGLPKLADIGLVASTTMALTFVGTEGFVAPEGPGTPGSDVYALGKVLYELVTGLDRKEFPQLPDGFESREDRVRFLELNAVIVRACDPDRATRHEHARSLLDDLLLVQAGKSVRRLRAAERGLARTIRVAGVLALIAAVAGAGAWVAWDRAQQEMALRAEAEAERDELARKTQYAGLLAQASRSIAREDLGFARELLGRAKKLIDGENTPFELGVLERKAAGDIDRFLRQKGAGVQRMDLSPDEDTLAVFDRSGTLQMIRLGDGEIQSVREGLGDFAGFSRDGNWYFGLDGEGRLSRWNRADGRIEYADFSGQYLWLLGVDFAGRVVAVERGQPGRIVRWDGRAEVTVDAGFLGEGEDQGWELFRASGDENLEKITVSWVRGRGREVEFLVTASAREIRSRIEPEIRPGSLSWVEGAMGGHLIEIVDPLTGANARWNPAGGDWKSGDEVMEPGSDRLWQRGSAEVSVRGVGSRVDLDRSVGQRKMYGASGRITDVKISKKGDYLYTGTDAGEVLGWDLDSTAGVLELETGLGVDELNFVFTSSGEMLAVASSEGAKLFDAKTLRMTEVLEKLRRPIGSGNGRIWGLATDGLEPIVIDEKSGKILTEVSPNAGAPVLTTGATTNVEAVVFTRADGTLWLDRLETPVRRFSLGKPGYSWGLSIDREMRRVWSTNREQRVFCRNVETGDQVWAVTMPAMASWVCLTPDESQVAVAIENGEIHFLDTVSGHLNRVLEAGVAAPQAILFEPTGNRMFVAGDDGSVHVFDTQSWLYLVALDTGDTTPLGKLAVSPDGKTLATLDQRGRLGLMQSL